MKLDILNVTTAAAELHVSAQTARLLFGRGDIAGAFKLGGRWFVRRKDLVAAIRKLAERPAPAGPAESAQLSIPMAEKTT